MLENEGKVARTVNPCNMRYLQAAGIPRFPIGIYGTISRVKHDLRNELNHKTPSLY
jgi:hypothetical protein